MHAPEHEQQRAARRPERTTAQAIRSNAHLVAAYRTARIEQGLDPDWCPGIPGRVDPHPCDPPGGRNPPTADHVPAVAHGGSELGPRVVRCRSCNSKLGATVRRTS